VKLYFPVKMAQTAGESPRGRIEITAISARIPKLLYYKDILFSSVGNQ
jgi:hypothetical protein